MNSCRTCGFCWSGRAPNNAKQSDNLWTLLRSIISRLDIDESLIDLEPCARSLNSMKKFDPTTLEIYRALYTSVAEEMGIALRRTSFSPNIKERRDYSCAVFDSTGRVIAQGDHMPVHLGSMPMAVAAALKAVELRPGDIVILTDRFAG